MTASNDPHRTPAGYVPVYGEHGQPIATVGASRSRWLGTLLSECPAGHVYVLPESLEDWQHAGCPRCRVSALTPGVVKGKPHED